MTGQARRAAALLLALLLAGAALAERVVIDTFGDPDARAEFRTVTLPGGAVVELVVITAETVQITIGEQVITGSHIEFDSTNRVVRLVGFGAVSTESETLQGDDLTLELDDETFGGRDVLIVTGAIDVVGDSASRVPGQISVLAGRFSPCSRCDQAIDDYGFSAARIELFPGDRLVAWDVQVWIRGRAVFGLPFMVLPLGPPERQPRLTITQGTETDRASIELDLPYAAGPDAWGTYLLRYYADVVPEAGNFFEEGLLGGGVDTSYLGGGIEHRFYTERGRGALDLLYVPSFLDPDAEGGRIPPEWTVRFAYATEGELGPPSLDVLFVRDDGEREGLAEYSVTSVNVRNGVRGRFLTQGFFPTRDDADTTPSYAGRSIPLRTFGQLNLTPEAYDALALGPFRLERLELDLGAFEDVSNATNRSAAVDPTVAAGRLLEGHTLALRPVTTPFGLELSGFTDFTGLYYTTAERLIAWDTRLAATQRVGGIGSLSLTFTRDINEGETPFRFDQIPLRNRTDLALALSLRPLSWVSLDVRSSYLFEDSRLRQAVGVQPIETTLSLFSDVRWIDLVFRNSVDLQEGDPGDVEGELTLRGDAGPVSADLTVTHVQDLMPEPRRLSGGIEDTSETSLDLAASYADLVALEVDGGYRYRPDLTDDPLDREYWLPLRAAVTVGTPEQTDLLPSLRLEVERDLNRGAFTRLGYQAAARVADLELTAEQSFDLTDGVVDRPTTGRYRARWPGIAEFEASGFALVQPAWLGLEVEEGVESWRFTLRDAPLDRDPVFQLDLRTTYNPTLDDGAGGFANTVLQSTVDVQQSVIGGVRFEVDLFAELALGDDLLETTYLRRGDLTLSADIAGRVGVQGRFGYTGVCCTGGELTRAQLGIDDFTVTVRVLDDLFVGALLDDVWDFSGNVAGQSPFNLQPTLFVALDRCCWALYGSWDTETGAIAITLTTPGGSQGFQQFLETPLVLPGREDTP